LPGRHMARALMALGFGILFLSFWFPPAFGAASIALSASSGTVSTSITVTGSGFLANTQVTVSYDGAVVGNATSSGTGTCKVIFAVPSSVRGGGHIVSATDGSNTATAPAFTVTSSLTRSPTSGTVGTTITLTGFGYAASTTVTVRWDGALLATSPSPITTDSKGAFVATVLAPSGEPVSHDIVAADAGGSVTVTFTLSRNLVLSPSTGPATTVVLMTGSGFIASSPISVTFDGAVVATTPATITSDALGGFLASFTVPPASPGARTVKATDGIGGSATATFTMTPSISLSVNTGRGGTSVTVTGTGFALASTVTMRFDGALISTVPTDSSGGFSQIFSAPPVPAGAHIVSAIDTLGTSASATFTVTPLLSIVPATGPVGTIVTATGAGFSASSVVTLLFAGSALTTTPSMVSTDIYGGFTASIAVPSISAGAWSIMAVDSSNLRSSATFTVSRKLSFSSATGTVGTVVVVRGEGFAPSSHVIFTFDASVLTTAPSLVIADSYGRFNVSFSIPEAIQGSHVIIVDDLTGNPVSTTYTVTPLITLNPTSGNVGTVVTATGKGFGPNSLVGIAFDGSSIATTPSTVATNAIGSFTATFTDTSSAAGAHTVKGTDLFGNTYSATFTVVRKITLSSHSGAVLAAITVTGYGFAAGSSVSMTWSGSPLSFLPSPLLVNSTGYFVAIFTVPLDFAGLHTVIAMDGVSNTASDVYAITPAVALTPGGLGVGDQLWIAGTGFSALSQVTIDWDGASVSTQPSTVTTDGKGSFTASFGIPPCAFGSHRAVAVDQRGNGSSTTYTLSSTSSISVVVDVGAIYFRGEVAEFYVLATQNGKPFDASDLTAKLLEPGALVQDLSGSATKVSTGTYKIDYTVAGDAAPGTYALVVNASKTVNGVTSYGSDLKAFEVSQTFGTMNATLTAIDKGLATIDLDLGPVLIKLDEVNASISSLIVSSKGEVLASISSTAGTIISKLNLISASLSSIGNGQATISTSLGTVEVDLATIGAKIDSLKGDVALVKTSIGSLNVSLASLSPKLTGIQGDVLTLQTDVGALEVKLDDLKATSIAIENGLVKIDTDVGSIIAALENLTGLTITVRTQSGSGTVTLLTDMQISSVEYRESEQSILFSCNKEAQSQGRLTMIIPKGLLSSLGSSSSNVKLLVDGQGTSYSLLELPNIYVLHTSQGSGEHQMTLYLNGVPSILMNPWLWMGGLALMLALGGGFVMVRSFSRRSDSSTWT